jgi:RND family efflux transporter MFP subunit
MPALRKVPIAIAARRDLARSITLSSELRPYDSVNLYAKVSGYLREIDVDYGSRVAAGQTIATLDLPEQQAELERAQAAYNLAKVDFNRIDSVARQEPGLIAQVDVDKARADYEMAQDQYNQAQVMTQYGTITAPFDGVVTKRYVDPGALISQGTASTNASPIVEISDNYQLRMVMETPETVVATISVGMPVTVKIQATGQTIAARVARFSYDLHEETRTMHTEVDVANPNLAIKPGMFATVTFALARANGVVTVPTQALATDPMPNVWVVDPDDVLRERPVTVGLQTPNDVEIRSGIRAGDRVFVGDRGDLVVGTRVLPQVVTAPRAEAPP